MNTIIYKSLMEKEIAEIGSKILQIAGIIVIVAGGVYSSIKFLFQKIKKNTSDDAFKSYRHQLGKSILLGLEFLVGADIIQTVALDLDFYSLGVLAVIIVIRTFLSFTLELELSGKWPWQSRKEKSE